MKTSMDLNKFLSQISGVCANLRNGNKGDIYHFIKLLNQMNINSWNLSGVRIKKMSEVQRSIVFQTRIANYVRFNLNKFSQPLSAEVNKSLVKVIKTLSGSEDLASYKIAIHGIFYNNKDKTVLVGYGDNPWRVEIPGGKVDQGEEVWQAFVRECKEEVNLTPKKGICLGLPTYNTEHNMLCFKVLVTEWEGDVQNNEPEKVDDVCWLPCDSFLNQLDQGSTRMDKHDILRIKRIINPTGVETNDFEREIVELNTVVGSTPVYYYDANRFTPEGYMRISINNDDNQCLLHAMHIFDPTILPVPGRKLDKGIDVAEYFRAYPMLAQRVAAYDVEDKCWYGNKDGNITLIFESGHCEVLVKTDDYERITSSLPFRGMVVGSEPEIQQHEEVILESEAIVEEQANDKQDITSPDIVVGVSESEIKSVEDKRDKAESETAKLDDQLTKMTKELEDSKKEVGDVSSSGIFNGLSAAMQQQDENIGDTDWFWYHNVIKRVNRFVEKRTRSLIRTPGSVLENTMDKDFLTINSVPVTSMSQAILLSVHGDLTNNSGLRGGNNVELNTREIRIRQRPAVQGKIPSFGDDTLKCLNILERDSQYNELRIKLDQRYAPFIGMKRYTDLLLLLKNIETKGEHVICDSALSYRLLLRMLHAMPVLDMHCLSNYMDISPVYSVDANNYITRPTKGVGHEIDMITSTYGANIVNVPRLFPLERIGDTPDAGAGFLENNPVRLATIPLDLFMDLYIDRNEHLSHDIKRLRNDAGFLYGSNAIEDWFNKYGDSPWIEYNLPAVANANDAHNAIGIGFNNRIRVSSEVGNNPYDLKQVLIPPRANPSPAITVKLPARFNYNFQQGFEPENIDRTFIVLPVWMEMFNKPHILEQMIMNLLPHPITRGAYRTDFSANLTSSPGAVSGNLADARVNQIGSRLGIPVRPDANGNPQTCVSMTGAALYNNADTIRVEGNTNILLVVMDGSSDSRASVRPGGRPKYNVNLFKRNYNPGADFNNAPILLNGINITEKNLPLEVDHSLWRTSLVGIAGPGNNNPRPALYTNASLARIQRDMIVNASDAVRWCDWYDTNSDVNARPMFKSLAETVPEMRKWGYDEYNIDLYKMQLCNELFNVYWGNYASAGGKSLCLTALEPNNCTVDAGQGVLRDYVRCRRNLNRAWQVNHNNDRLILFDNNNLTRNIKRAYMYNLTTTPIGLRMNWFPTNRANGWAEEYRHYFDRNMYQTSSVVRVASAFGKIYAEENEFKSIADTFNPYDIWLSMYNGAKYLAVAAEKYLYSTNMLASHLLFERNERYLAANGISVNYNEVAKRLVYKWRKDSKLPPFKLGGTIYESWNSLFPINDLSNVYNAAAGFHIMKNEPIFTNQKGQFFGQLQWNVGDTDFDSNDLRSWFSDIYFSRWNRFNLTELDPDFTWKLPNQQSIDYTTLTPEKDLNSLTYNERWYIMGKWEKNTHPLNFIDFLSNLDSHFKFTLYFEHSLVNVGNAERARTWIHGFNKDYLTYGNLRNNMYRRLALNNSLLEIIKFNVNLPMHSVSEPQDKRHFTFFQEKGRWGFFVTTLQTTPLHERIDNEWIFKEHGETSDDRVVLRNFPITQDINFEP